MRFASNSATVPATSADVECAHHTTVATAAVLFGAAEGLLCGEASINGRTAPIVNLEVADTSRARS